MEDCNPSLMDGLVNFTKCEMIGGVIQQVMEYQQLPYTYIKPIEELGILLANLPVATKELEQKNWTYSKSIE